MAMKLKIFFVTFVTSFLASQLLGRGKKINQTLVDQYVEYITDRQQAALQYEFPSNARIFEPTNETIEEFGYYDFIVIGAGSAGCVIANRLSEIQEWQVLLLEAGTYRDEDMTGIPQLWAVDSFTKFDWGFRSVPQKHACLGSTDKRCFVPRGKGVGGSSLINTMIYSRGNKLDYESWSQLVNDPEWNYENVLPYFKKSENFTRTNPYVPIDEEYHGLTGPLHMTQSSPPQNLSFSFLQASEELGYSVTDYNGRQQEGASVMQFQTKDGRRFDSENAYIKPAKNRNNLKVLDRSYVIKIEITDDTKEAKSVIFTRQDKTFIARNRKEVILSAGAISSPQILMLSGIGPQNDLQSLGIPVVQNLPVGQTLHDHTSSPINLSINVSLPLETLEQSVVNLLKGQGTLTRPVSPDAVGWCQTSLEQQQNYPDLEMFFFNISSGGVTQKFFNYADDVFKAVSKTVQNSLTIILIPLRPKSVGSVKLASNDPFEYPLIDTNFLSAKEDLDTLYETVQIVSKLIETETFRKLNATLSIDDKFPGCSDEKFLSREFWDCYFRQVTFVGFHPTSTCLMGRTPATGVVNRQLKVFGIEKLRVADGSVIPFPISGHTNAPCTMIGEKASDIIKKHYGQ